MIKNTIRIGTRGSNLALYQAHRVKDLLEEKFPELTIELNIIKTKGDKILDTALSKIGDKGLFTKEIEVALLENTADIAVHSLKDLSTELPEGLKLSAVLKRGDIRDALVHKKGKKISELDNSDIIATSSLRRIAGLKNIVPGIKIVDIRGNVNTRLQKMQDGHCDGMIMAAAGLQRLGLEEFITELIEPEQIIPAVAQGAIAIESRTNDDFTNTILEKINHHPTHITVLGERKFLNTLQGGCQVPVGCYSTLDNNMLSIKGFVANLDGSIYLMDSITGSPDKSVILGEMLAEKLIDKGGKNILDEIRGA